MKPYEERLPLIDAAIEELGGKWPNSDYDIESYLVKLDTGTYVLTAGLVSDPRCNICNRTQFEKRAKELGYINGYKWGVEYETNGEKPDLPDDALVQVDTECVSIGWSQCESVGYWYWKSPLINKFRIVDERYKPKEQDMNDWYEKGELLVAGSKHEVFNGKDWIPAKFIGIDHDNRGLVFKTREGYLCYEKIRPLRTGTDKLVEEALEILKNDYATHLAMSDLDMRMCAETMIEAGYRKIKPMSEDEFVQDVLKHFDFEVSQFTLICEALRKLHSAGCRFIEQGE